MNSEISSSVAAATSGIRVLLVDDQPLILDRLAASLGALDKISVIGTAEDVDLAKILAHSLAPDLVVLDINLDGVEAWDLLQHLKSTSPEIQVFMFTNDWSPTTRARYLKGGADRFFDKSLEIAELRQAVSDLTGSTGV